MNGNPLITVIVPVYQVERYLCKCVDSILNQTYQNLEIILVDDGSPDNCPAICDEYAKKDGRIKVVHKQNGGVSSARNAGLDICTGDYIGFVDSDDWIEPIMMEKMLSFFEDSVDLVICQFENRVNRGRTKPELLSQSELVNRTFMRPALKDCYLDVYHNVWAKLFRTSLWNNIRFDTTLRIAEDEAAMAAVSLIVRNAVRLCDVLYQYTYNPDSAMSSTDNKKRFEQSLCVDTQSITLCCKNAYVSIFRAKYLFDLVNFGLYSDRFDRFKTYRKEIINNRSQYLRDIGIYKTKYKVILLGTLVAPRLVWMIIHLKRG